MQKKEESDGIQGDLDRIVDLVFGEDDEDIIERGDIGEGDFHKNIKEHRDKEEISENPLHDSGTEWLT